MLPPMCVCLALTPAVLLVFIAALLIGFSVLRITWFPLNCLMTVRFIFALFFFRKGENVGEWARLIAQGSHLNSEAPFSPITIQGK